MSRGLGQNGYRRVGDSAEVSADSALPQTLTPALSHPPVGERGTATLTPDPLELIAEGRHSVEAICIELDMSILELAEHVCTAQNLETLARVKQLHATQREVMLGRLKRDALMRLGELTAEVGAMNANEVRACEVMRKACVDILRADDRGMNTERRPSGTGGPGSPWGPGGGRRREPITPASEAEVLEALERWGAEENQYEPDEPRGLREPSGPPRCTSGSVVRPPPETNMRTGKMLVPLVEAPSQAPLESRLPIDSRSRNGPGITGGRASGSYLESPPPPESPPAPPPVVEGTLQALRAHHVQMVGWEWEHGGCLSPPLWVRAQRESA